MSQLLFGVLEIDIVLGEQGMDLHARLIAEHDAHFILGEPGGAIAIDRNCLQRGERFGFTWLAVICAKRGIVRDGEGQLHGLRIDQFAENLSILPGINAGILRPAMRGSE